MTFELPRKGSDPSRHSADSRTKGASTPNPSNQRITQAGPPRGVRVVNGLQTAPAPMGG
jgi:hypothetical protein